MKTKFPLFAAAFSVVLLAFSDLATATDQVVNDLGDTGGPQQLRAKLSDCLSSGGGTITFSAAGTVFLNPPAGPLPAISGANPISVTVDGGNKIVINGGDATRIFNVSTGATLTLRNLTISHAFANADGGAVASTGTLNVVNTNFFNNATSTSWSGSAILCWGPLTITNSEFGSNSGGGGAVKPRSSGAITTITGCKFHDNQSNFDGNGGGGYGGAMQLHDAPSVTVSNCTFTNNSAARTGGAIYVNVNSGLTVTDSTFTQNSSYDGGGIQSAGTATIRRTTFDHNSAAPYPSEGLGGGFANTATATLENVTFSANSAGGGGGGVEGAGGTTSITNCTFSGNSSASTRPGGGDNLRSAGDGTVVNVKNTIVAGGTKNNCGYYGGSIIGDHSLSDDGTCGFATNGGADNVTDLLLGQLADNGGPTQTILPQPGSRGIDRGIDTGAPATDQRGIERPQLAEVDVGAVEVVPLKYESTDPLVRYDGWSGLGQPNANGGFFRWSNFTNDTVTYKFKGTSIKWITWKGTELGKALVTIDGVNKGTFDLYRSTILWNYQILFGGLADAAHTIVIKVTGTKNANAIDYFVPVDGFLVGSSTKVVQESALAVQYDKWMGKKQAAASGGSFRLNPGPGAAEFDFDGTSVSFITARGPNYGKVNVFLDGQLVSPNLDLYAPTQQWQYKMGYSGLTNGAHVIDIEPTHTKSAASKGFGVVLDALEAFPRVSE